MARDYFAPDMRRFMWFRAIFLKNGEKTNFIKIINTVLSQSLAMISDINTKHIEKERGMQYGKPI